jgi:hypothetical protein
MPRNPSQPIRSYTGGPLAVSRGALALPASTSARARPGGVFEAPIEAAPSRFSARLFLAGLIAIMAGWMLVASHPAALSAIAARIGGLAWGRAAPGIEIAHAEAHRAVVGGQTILYVAGALANKSVGALKPPGLVITIVGDDDQPLYSWTTKVAQSRIETSREAPFQARLLSPPETFKSIKVSLAKEG